MKILDLSAGNRAIWFDKKNPLTLFIDIRESVEPMIVADSRALPSCIETDYDLIVFDPPHVNVGANSHMTKYYGHHTTAEIRDIIARTSAEAHRVTRKDALMAFKWNDHTTKLNKVLELMDEHWEPLFGHKTSMRTKHATQTYWVMLIRRDTPLGKND